MRGATLSTKRMKRDRRAARGLPILVDEARPVSRGECRDAARPCLFVSCRFHLYLDVNGATGSVKLNFPDKEPWELEHSCALDVAEQGGRTLEELSRLLNLTRERVRQLEHEALSKLGREADG
jgi:hypothetical protein